MTEATSHSDKTRCAAPFVLNISLQELGLFDVSTVHRIWLFCIGLSAFFDFMATVVPEWIPSQRTNGINRDDYAWIVDEVQFFDKNAIPFSIFFSLLWFLNAFVKSKEDRDKKRRELDRKRLFGELDDCPKETTLLKGARGAYYRAMAFQLFLLPVGFYRLIWHCLFSWHPRDIFLAQEEQVEILFRGSQWTKEYQIYTTHTSYCLFFVIAKKFVNHISRVTGAQLKANIMRSGIIISKRLAIFAVRNPKRFASCLRNSVTCVRWLKYLAPLIGTSYKLRENVKDLVKKFHQRRDAIIARRLRNKVWKEQKKDIVTLKEAAAIKIQSIFRGRQTRKMITAVNMIRYQKIELATISLQRVMRTWLARARTRVMKRKAELRSLQKKQFNKNRDHTIMNDHDRRRLYELQDELKVEAVELLNRKLLLRPNTTFSVTWKTLFIVCVLFEIGQLAFTPMITNMTDDKTGKPMNIDKDLHSRLVPKPVSEWDACYEVQNMETKKSTGPKILHSLTRIIPKWRIVKTSNDKLKPWFCRHPYNTAQRMYVSFLHFVVTEFLVLVGIVCFLDVFITFFTGEISNETGALIPKPFIQRWILPGIALQLLVNPQMETTAKWGFRVLSKLMHFGPDRVWRWTAALFFPLFRVVVFGIEFYLWTPLVARQNKHSVTLSHIIMVTTKMPTLFYPPFTSSYSKPTMEPPPPLKIKKGIVH